MAMVTFPIIEFDCVYASCKGQLIYKPETLFNIRIETKDSSTLQELAEMAAKTIRHREIGNIRFIGLYRKNIEIWERLKNKPDVIEKNLEWDSGIILYGGYPELMLEYGCSDKPLFHSNDVDVIMEKLKELGLE